MLTPPSFTKKNDFNTFTAEISTKMEMSNEFFLRPGMAPEDLPSRNDSFSFNNKSKEIFNPVENYSCIKKETPKFGRSENHTSTPSQNIIQKLALIKNKIRLVKTFNEVLKQDPNSISDFKVSELFPGEKARLFSNKAIKKNRLYRSSKKINRRYQNENEIDSSNSSFLSKGKRMGSQQHKRGKKGPKILGQKHLEIFHSKYLNKQKNMNERFDCFVSNSTQNKSNANQQKRTKQVNFKDQIMTSQFGKSQNRRPKYPWPDMFPLISTPKMIPKPTQLKAKHLPKQFQTQFRKGIMSSFRMISSNASNKSASKENKKKLSTEKNKNNVKFYDHSAKRNRNKKLNLRYQSARKCNVPMAQPSDLGLTQHSSKKTSLENPFLMRELRSMIEKKKGRPSVGQNPVSPSIDFRL